MWMVLTLTEIDNVEGGNCQRFEKSALVLGKWKR